MWSKDEDLSVFGIRYTPQTKTIPLGDKILEAQVFEIPLEKLRYNASNGRIFMEVNKLKTTSSVDLKQLESSDVDEFNKEFERLIWESEIDKNEATLESIGKYGQLEIGVVLSDGVVIDGNRRFTCLRKLHEKYPSEEKYSYFKAAILFTKDDNITKKEIKKYELQVQFGRDKEVNYKAVNFSMSIYQEVKSGDFTVQEIAADVNKKTNEITKIIHTCELIESFLKYIHQEEQLYIIEELKLYFPLEPLGSYLKNAESKLSAVEIEKRKFMFFDFLIGIDVALPTQEFRDNLIGKVFKSPKHFTKLDNDYQQLYKKILFDTLIKPTVEPEEFVNAVQKFKTTEVSEEIKNRYIQEVKAIEMELMVDQPIKLCKEMIEILKNIDITSFLDSTSTTADDKLREIKKYLEEGKVRIDDFDKKICEKLGIK
ncbi:hypothetical protein J5751_03740 [bacterium]|nr:hypothetical protein [bacterium]